MSGRFGTSPITSRAACLRPAASDPANYALDCDEPHFCQTLPHVVLVHSRHSTVHATPETSNPRLLDAVVIGDQEPTGYPRLTLTCAYQRLRL